ncbi:hypothetical protein SISNIDRAFT_402226, partial [Sistotremastrum niveocremeum HHB9708]
EFGDSVRVEWAKSRARWLRWDEEVKKLCDEMRCVLTFLEWEAAKWLSLVGTRSDLSPLVSAGMDAYAKKQAWQRRKLARRFAVMWWPTLELHDLPRQWPAQYLQSQSQPLSHPPNPPV